MHCIGIDLGTTNSLVSYWDETEGKVKLIPNEFGDTLTPSVVGFPKGAEVLVGKAAKEMLINEPDRASVSYTHLRAHQNQIPGR